MTKEELRIAEEKFNDLSKGTTNGFDFLGELVGVDGQDTISAIFIKDKETLQVLQELQSIGLLFSSPLLTNESIGYVYMFLDCESGIYNLGELKEIQDKLNRNLNMLRHSALS